jgi:putative peptidoglycan lipid II flippase
MLAGVAFWTVQQIVGRAFYAWRDTLTPALAGTAATVAALPLYWFGATRYGPAGVAAAGVLGVALYTGLICFLWRRRFGTGGLRDTARRGMRSFAFCLPACAAGYGATLWLERFFPADSLWGAATQIAASGAVFGGVYLALAFVFAPFLYAPLAGPFARLRRRSL